MNYKTINIRILLTLLLVFILIIVVIFISKSIKEKFNIDINNDDSYLNLFTKKFITNNNIFLNYNNKEGSILKKKLNNIKELDMTKSNLILGKDRDKDKDLDFKNISINKNKLNSDDIKQLFANNNIIEYRSIKTDDNSNKQMDDNSNKPNIEVVSYNYKDQIKGITPPNLLCIDDNCINHEHIAIINGNKTIKLKNGSNDSNSEPEYIIPIKTYSGGDGHVRHGKQLQHTDINRRPLDYTFYQFNKIDENKKIFNKILVNVGPSSTNIVYMDIGGLTDNHIVPYIVNRTNWASTGKYKNSTDTFQITRHPRDEKTNKTKLSIKRLDHPTYGWYTDLKFYCENKVSPVSNQLPEIFKDKIEMDYNKYDVKFKYKNFKYFALYNKYSSSYLTIKDNSIAIRTSKLDNYSIFEFDGKWNNIESKITFDKFLNSNKDESDPLLIKNVETDNFLRVDPRINCNRPANANLLTEYYWEPGGWEEMRLRRIKSDESKSESELKEVPAILEFHILHRHCRKALSALKDICEFNLFRTDFNDQDRTKYGHNIWEIIPLATQCGEPCKADYDTSESCSDKYCRAPKEYNVPKSLQCPIDRPKCRYYNGDMGESGVWLGECSIAETMDKLAKYNGKINNMHHLQSIEGYRYDKPDNSIYNTINENNKDFYNEYTLRIAKNKYGKMYDADEYIHYHDHYHDHNSSENFTNYNRTEVFEQNAELGWSLNIHKLDNEIMNKYEFHKGAIPFEFILNRPLSTKRQLNNLTDLNQAFFDNLGLIDYFSAYAYTQITPIKEGYYEFQLNSDDGGRFYIYDVIQQKWSFVIDNGGAHGSKLVKGIYFMEANKKYYLFVHMYETWGLAYLQLKYSFLTREEFLKDKPFPSNTKSISERGELNPIYSSIIFDNIKTSLLNPGLNKKRGWSLFMHNIYYLNAYDRIKKIEANNNNDNSNKDKKYNKLYSDNELENIRMTKKIYDRECPYPRILRKYCHTIGYKTRRKDQWKPVHMWGRNPEEKNKLHPHLKDFIKEIYFQENKNEISEQDIDKYKHKHYTYKHVDDITMRLGQYSVEELFFELGGVHEARFFLFTYTKIKPDFDGLYTFKLHADYGAGMYIIDIGNNELVNTKDNNYTTDWNNYFNMSYSLKRNSEYYILVYMYDNYGPPNLRIHYFVNVYSESEQKKGRIIIPEGRLSYFINGTSSIDDITDIYDKIINKKIKINI